MSEQSPSANSQSNPQSHGQQMEAKIMSLLDPQGQPEEKVEAPAEVPEKQETQDQPEAKADSEEQPAEPKEDKPEIPEAEEIEYEGKTYKVAPELKDALLRQKDYTVKTQEAAEIRKNYEAALQQANQVLELQKAQGPILGKIASLDEQIAQYEKVDWNTLTAQDATRAQQLFIAFQTAKDAKAKAVSELEMSQRTMMEGFNKARHAKLEDGHKALARDIKGWNADLGRKILASTQKAYGAPAEQLGAITEPWAVKALHDAMQWRDLQSSKLVEKKAPPKEVTLKTKGSESRTPAQQSYDSDVRALKSARTNSDRSKAAEKLILRKLG